jgi:hypothetical protein
MKERAMEFTADLVWACAAAADRINGGYCKEPVYSASLNVVEKEPNKLLVKQWLREGAFGRVTEADYAAGRSYRDHFKSYTLLAMAGKLNDFQQTAMRVAAMDTFTGRNMLEFAIVSCLPATARRDQERTELKRELFSAPQLNAAVGETVIGDVDVISCSYNQLYNKYMVKARMGESHVNFYYGEQLQGTHRIKGKVKAHRGDNTTTLNYVKRA